MSKKIQTIGILTGGGDCPGLNAVIRAVVKAATVEHGWKVLGIQDGYDGLVWTDKIRPLGSAEVAGILPRGGTILGTSNRGNPFAYPFKENGKTVVKDISPTILENIPKLGIDALVVVGGDGTLKIGLELWRRGVPLVGVPKTIDNDLSATEITFGFDTALHTVTDAIDKIHTTAESHHRIMLVEVMGRDAGWIAVQSGIAGGAHIILIPELPFSLDKICAKIQERAEAGRHFSVVVVAEGCRMMDGRPIGGVTHERRITPTGRSGGQRHRRIDCPAEPPGDSRHRLGAHPARRFSFALRPCLELPPGRCGRRTDRPRRFRQDGLLAERFHSIDPTGESGGGSEDSATAK